ncbi:MAG: cation diffusion facilitator family transporter [Bacilli bacterium]|nr:cation diffusion facilitator family transporter [Bacilli bacterium]
MENKHKMLGMKHNRQLQILLYITLALNIVLATIKLWAGYAYLSPSLQSDGYNSLFDVGISIMLIIILKTSNRAPDHNHHYGHQKYEGLLYFALGLFILFSTIVLGIESVKGFIGYLQNNPVEKPDLMALYIAIISVLIKVLLFTINFLAYKKFKRPALKGDAYNHLSDIFATAVSIIAIILAQFNFFIFEYIGSFIIMIIIINTSFKIIKEAAYYLTDVSPSPKTIAKIREAILLQKDVLFVDDLKVRRHMNNYYVDVEIGVSKDLSFEEAHIISENVHHYIEANFKVLHCHVHMNPH